MDRLTELLQRLSYGNLARDRRRKILMSLAVVVVFVTTYMLILPAITLEKDKAEEIGAKNEAAVEQVENTEQPEAEPPAAATISPADLTEKETDAHKEKAEKALEEKRLEISDVWFYQIELDKEGEPEEVEIELKKPVSVPKDAEITVISLADSKPVIIKDVKTKKNGKDEVTAVQYEQKESGTVCVCVTAPDPDEDEAKEPEAEENESATEPEPNTEEAAPETDGGKTATSEEEEADAQQEDDSSEEQDVPPTEEQPKEMDSEEPIDQAPAAEDTSTPDEPENSNDPELLTFNGSAGDVKVTVTAPADAFPANVEMTVTPVKAEDILETVENTINGSVTSLKAVDISFYSGTRKVQPEKPIQVSLISRDVPTLENPMVVHIQENGRGELIEGAEQDDKKMTFEANHFSVYAVVDGNTGDEARATVNFYGKDLTTPLATVYVKNSDDAAHLEDIVFDPGAGFLADGELFRGWSIDNPDYTVEQDPLTIEGVRAHLEALDITEGMEVSIYAMIFNGYSIQFKDEDGVTIHSETLINRTGEPITYTINTLYTPKEQDEAFQGWIPTTGSDKLDPAKEIYQNGDQVEVSGNVIFSPDAPSGYWLIFRENGSGVSYTAPQFITSGNVPTQPADPTRPGYSFGGWFKDEACTQPFDFSQELTQRTTVFAKWTANPQATYTVIVWKQSVSDAYDAADANKTYDFAFSQTLTANSNAAVSGLNLSQYTGLDGGSITVDGTTHSFYGFEYNTTKGIASTDTEVQPNGTTVVNIYYDREVATMDFNVVEYNRVTPRWNSGNTYYVQVGEDYYQCYRQGNNTYYYVQTTTVYNNTDYYVNINGNWETCTVIRYNGQWYVRYNNDYYDFNTWPFPFYS